MGRHFRASVSPSESAVLWGSSQLREVWEPMECWQEQLLKLGACLITRHMFTEPLPSARPCGCREEEASPTLCLPHRALACGRRAGDQTVRALAGPSLSWCGASGGWLLEEVNPQLRPEGGAGVCHGPEKIRRSMCAQQGEGLSTLVL